ncbi:GxxExxY protein [Bacillota bacterium LX-D]|nr:GxxExxY protein [Bacillota bacterium LX-D]
MNSFDFLLIGIIIGLILYYCIAKKYKRKKNQTRLKVAKQAETAAARLLLKAGYEIIASQKKIQYSLKFDGQTIKNLVIADFIVQKKNKTYLVEVKTGKQTLKPTAPAIRRQLLEYFLVFKTDGIILIDMNEKIFHEIEFAFSRANVDFNTKAVIVSFLLGIFLTCFLLLNLGYF